MLKCFCPVVFRLEWLSAFCEIFKRCFLSFPAEVFKVFPSKLFGICSQSIQSISLQVILVFAGASQLSAEQEHQREQVNHLALTSGGDLFPRLHLFPQLFT